MISGIEGKKVLLLATSFFGYERKMQQQMMELGADVDFYDERCIKSSWDKALLKLSPKLFRNKQNAYCKAIIAENRKNYDYVFIYGATMLEAHQLKMFREAYKQAVFTLYVADSILGNKRYESLFEYMDRVYTFDYRDWRYYKKMTDKVFFLPLFYSPDYENDETSDAAWDLSFVGTIHSDRLGFLEQIKEQAEQKGLKVNFYYYLPGWFIFYFYWLTNEAFRKKKYKDFRYVKLSSQDIRSIIYHSAAVVDIQYPKNTGLTMRTIETLGMNRKIITTNESIRYYDFYHEDNVQILDRRNPRLSELKLKSDYVRIDEKVYSRYSLKHWILYQMDLDHEEEDYIVDGGD